MGARPAASLPRLDSPGGTSRGPVLSENTAVVARWYFRSIHVAKMVGITETDLDGYPG